jgi:peptidoglycan glycosyltransferase
MAGGFVLLIALLGWWQVLGAGSLNDRPGNPQAAQRERLVDRGRIISADGVVLAASRAEHQGAQTVYRRVYPQGGLAPHVVGYSSPSQGRTGLESTWNRYLAGSYGTEPLLQRLRLRAKQGADVHVTLDTRVQRTAVDGLRGLKGAVVALDPRTGAVLAMASSPTFNLNDVASPSQFARIRGSGSALLDRATQGGYPPGSSFKVVTATAALKTGRFTPDTSFHDTGVFVENGLPIRNFGGEVWGDQTLTGALTHSVNTIFARVGHDLGAKTLGAEMSEYGFGKRPPIDLPSDQVLASGRYEGGRLLANDQSGEDAARIAIGQERLRVTPLQMAMVASAVADGGVLHAPYLLTRAVDRGGATVVQQRPRVLGTTSPPQVAAELNDMMRNVVQEGTGTAANLSTSGVQVAGKTGTAETGVAGRNDAWFIGFAPASRPVVAVAVVVEGTSQTGGAVAAPIAARVIHTAVGLHG